MDKQALAGVVARQREFFIQGHTLDVALRVSALKKLGEVLRSREAEIIEASQRDFYKSAFECFFSELFYVLEELEFALKHIHSWTRPQWVTTDALVGAGRSFIRREPFGCCLILGPWNAPFYTNLVPLISAVAAGNCVVIKPSERGAHAAALLASIISEVFDPAHVTVALGDAAVGEALLALRFDFIMLTGSSATGRVVCAAAARNLTPVLLELGGKSPAIVTRHADLDAAARRIVWGRFFYAGQICLAPDFVCVDATVKERFVALCARYVRQFYGDDPSSSPDYARLVDAKQFDRLVPLLEEGSIIIGGQASRDSLYIAPTIIDGVSWGHAIMQEEIFGPILPVLSYQQLGDALQHIRALPTPLALYVFSSDQEEQQAICRAVPSGDVAVNTVMDQNCSPRLPFGGLGASGMGKYHGRAGFEAFSHQRSFFIKRRGENCLKYPPYGGRTRWLKLLFWGRLSGAVRMVLKIWNKR